MAAPVRVVKFKTEYRVDREYDTVLLAPADENFDKVQSWQRVKDLIPPEDADESVRNSETYKAMKGRWDVIKPQYEAWKHNTAMPETGTPLAAWAGVTVDMAEVLKQLGVRTVEDVTGMTEGQIKRVPFPNARQLPKLAKEYLEGRTASQKDAELEDMRQRVAVMEEMLQEKRGPGRPKKAEAA